MISIVIIAGCQFTLGPNPDPDILDSGAPRDALADELILMINEDAGVDFELSGLTLDLGTSTAGDENMSLEGPPLPFEDPLSLALNLPQLPCRGPWMCRAGQGCIDGACEDSCLQSSHCVNGDVCRYDATPQCGSCDEQNLCESGQECIEGVCLPRALMALSIQIAETDWLNLSEMRYQDGYWVPCTIDSGVINAPTDAPALNDREQPCRVRVHGGSSRDYRKLSLRVKLEEGDEELAWGDRHIVLRAEYNDPTMMRNVLSHLLFQYVTTLPQSRWRYIWLMVNGRPQGLYLQVERHRDPMLHRWGRAPSAPRYESDPPLGRSAAGTGSLVTLNARADYWESYELKSGANYEPLITLIENVLDMTPNRAWLDLGGTERLAELLDWGEYLRYLAVMARVQNLDHVRKNFLITRQLDIYQTPRWEVHPWDLDLSWGCLYNDETGLTLCDDVRWDVPLSVGFLPEGEAPSYPVTAFYNLLASRAISPESARTRYHQLLCTLTQSDDANPALTRLNAWRAALSVWLPRWIEATPLRPIEIEGTLQEHIAHLERFWRNRGDFIRQQLMCER